MPWFVVEGIGLAVEVSPSSGLASPSITFTAFESRSFTTKTLFSTMSCQPIYCAVTTGAAAELLRFSLVETKKGGKSANNENQCLIMQQGD